MDVRKIVDAIIAAVRKDIQANPPDDTCYAVYVSTEAADANLSIVSINGIQYRGVPRYSHVTGLVSGDTVECIHVNKSKPLTIIGKPVGDISAV